MPAEERRRYPRVIDEGLTLTLNADGFDAITHTLNISASGLYCKVDKEIPLMSRVRLKLMIPDVSGNEKEPKDIEVDGVVVREHPVIIDGRVKHYDIAIFFQDLSQKNRDIISGYICKKGS